MTKERVTVYLSEGVWKEFRLQCLKDGMSASAVIENLILKYNFDSAAILQTGTNLGMDFTNKKPKPESVVNDAGEIESMNVGKLNLLNPTEAEVHEDEATHAIQRANDRLKAKRVEAGKSADQEPVKGTREWYKKMHPNDICPRCRVRNMNCTCDKVI